MRINIKLSDTSQGNFIKLHYGSDDNLKISTLILKKRHKTLYTVYCVDFGVKYEHVYVRFAQIVKQISLWNDVITKTYNAILNHSLTD